MKTVFHLSNECTWEEGWAALIARYPCQIKNITGYKKVFEKMPGIVPKFTDQQLIIREFNKEDSYPFPDKNDLFGEDPGPHNDVFIINEKDPSSPHYSLLYVPWPELMGLKVRDVQNSQFGAAGIVAHCMFEMTFDGFSQNKADMVRWKYTKSHIARTKRRHLFKRRYFVKYNRFRLYN